VSISRPVLRVAFWLLCAGLGSAWLFVDGSADRSLVVEDASALSLRGVVPYSQIEWAVPVRNLRPFVCRLRPIHVSCHCWEVDLPSQLGPRERGVVRIRGQAPRVGQAAGVLAIGLACPNRAEDVLLLEFSAEVGFKPGLAVAPEVVRLPRRVTSSVTTLDLSLFHDGGSKERRAPSGDLKVREPWARVAPGLSWEEIRAGQFASHTRVTIDGPAHVDAGGGEFHLFVDSDASDVVVVKLVSD